MNNCRPHKTILVTGGAGYIGSHCCVALDQAGYRTVIVDNLTNSRADVFNRLARLCDTPPIFVQGDCRDTGLVQKAIADHGVDAVMHLAGLKAVAESLQQPVAYYDNNLYSLLSVVQAMQQEGVDDLIFSSTATVYSSSAPHPFSEDSPIAPEQPYARSKWMMEQILSDLHHASPQWRIGILRYFNPVGSHSSHLIGEYPIGIPNNLMPRICFAVTQKNAPLTLFGNDYPTDDGTCVRDYIHIMDLADGHVAALQHLRTQSGMMAFNLGTGHGVSVLTLVKTFAAVNQCQVPYIVGERRAGDMSAFWADVRRAQEVLKWSAQRDLTQMCRDAWQWQQQLQSED